MNLKGYIPNAEAEVGRYDSNWKNDMRLMGRAGQWDSGGCCC